MTNEERDVITQFIGRVGGTQQAGAFTGGSVPATTQPAPPPVDPDTDRLIRDLLQRYPEASYRITQLAFVQEHALAEAQNRIQRLQWELQQAQQAAQQPQPQQSGAGGGFFSGLFGGGRGQSAPPQGGPGPVWNQGRPPPGYQAGYQQAPPPPQYAPGYAPGMFQRSGSGFLGSALTTAAGVAGGMVAGNMLMNLFSGHQGFGGGMGGYPGGMMASGAVESPWATPAAGAVDQGTWDAGQGGAWDSAGAGAAPGQDFVDNGSWDQPADPTAGGTDSGWDSSGGGDPGLDNSGGSDDDSLL